MKTMKHMILGAVLCGLIAFIFGLFAPPVVGIFVTVPVGILVGAVVGAGFAKRQPAGEPPNYFDEK